ncbi:MAG: ATP-binding cassette domain-containing protein [Myxococcota bacterium]
MIVLRLMRRHDDARVLRIVVVSAVGGLLAAGTVATANFASNSERSGASLGLGLAFLAALAIMFLSNRWSARAIVEVYEEVQQTLRADLAKSLRNAPLRAVERLRDERGRAIGALTSLSTAVTQLVTLVQQAAFLVCMSLVIATVSLKALLIWLITGVAIGYWLSKSLRTLGPLHARQSEHAGALHTTVEELLDGFKQLKLDPVASEVITREVHAASSSLYRGHIDLAMESDRDYLIANTLFYSLGFGLAVFAPQSSLGLGPLVGYEVTILLALSIGPLFGFLQALPTVSEAESAAGTILEVLDGLAVAQADVTGDDGEERDDGQERDGGEEFSTLELCGVEFRYEARRGGPLPGFCVGPLDLTLRRGELVFITGGNGSGKTTLMKMLLGLYPVGGKIRWDGRVVRGDRLARYRGLFTAIFGGQFLFDRLYGLELPRERVDALLDRFGIADVVQFDGTRFKNLELSSGQRMRLAMVVALLEDRPVCVFDEWTANQDPKSTWMYYDTLLPELVREGKTVIAVSHDDRFFARADHLIQLDRGRVAVDRHQGPPSRDS